MCFGTFQYSVTNRTMELCRMMENWKKLNVREREIRDWEDFQI
jgi:hypothetical protein